MVTLKHKESPTYKLTGYHGNIIGFYFDNAIYKLNEMYTIFMTCF